MRSLLWFHPAVWWLLNRIHLSREQVVDYEVVRLIGSKQPYLDSLLEFARAKGCPKAVPAPLFLKERHLVQRVALLIKEVSMSRSRLAVSMISITVLLIGTAYVAVELFPLTGAPVFAQEPKDDVEINAPRREAIRVGGKEAESKLIRKVDPVYPEEALHARVQGRVVLAVTINEEGLVCEARVVSGHPFLNQAAIDAVKQWRYAPTYINDVPVPVMTTVTLHFRIDDNRMGMERLPDSHHAGDASTSPALAPLSTVLEGQGLLEKYFNLKVASSAKAAQGSTGDIRRPKLIYRVDPIYPDAATGTLGGYGSAHGER